MKKIRLYKNIWNVRKKLSNMVMRYSRSFSRKRSTSSCTLWMSMRVIRRLWKILHSFS
jgi:hypothetical protein